MTRDQALDFLQKHQPLPPDDELRQEEIDAYDEVRRFFLANHDREA